MSHGFVGRNIKVGDLRRISLTVPQAARILKVDADRIRKAIDRHVLTASLVREGKRQVRRLDGVDVLCFRMGDVVRNAVRQDVYLQLKQAPEDYGLDQALRLPGPEGGAGEQRRIVGYICDVAAETVADIRSLEERSSRIDDAGMIRGTGVEAHRIAALVGGMGIAEVLGDYPNLEEAQIEDAVDYARAHPKPGRPYPSKTAKSVLRKGGGGGLAAAFAAARDETEA